MATNKALPERSHSKSLDIREQGERIPIQLDRLTMALIPADMDPLTYIRQALAELWAHLGDGTEMGPVGILRVLTERFDVSYAQVAKIAVARHSASPHSE